MTTSGSGPDKWASVWFLERRFGPGSVRVVNPDALPIAGSVTFDLPGAPFDRRADSTTLAALVARFEPDSATANAMVRLVHEIEIDAWRHGTSWQAGVPVSSWSVEFERAGKPTEGIREAPVNR